MDASQTLKQARIVPVVVIEDADRAVPLAETLLAAGLSAIEITLRTDSALDAIRRVADAVPAMLVGAGSIRRPSQISEVQSAGARFAVSPGATDELLAAASDARLPLVPGAVTAYEVTQLMNRGYTLLKFFPAELAGGVAMLKALGAPLPEARFFPTGGITTKNAADYLALPNVACLGGTWITPADLLRSKDFEAIGRLAAAAAELG